MRVIYLGQKTRTHSLTLHYISRLEKSKSVPGGNQTALENFYMDEYLDSVECFEIKWIKGKGAFFLFIWIQTSQICIYCTNMAYQTDVLLQSTESRVIPSSKEKFWRVLGLKWDNDNDTRVVS